MCIAFTCCYSVSILLPQTPQDEIDQELDMALVGLFLQIPAPQRQKDHQVGDEVGIKIVAACLGQVLRVDGGEQLSPA